MLVERSLAIGHGRPAARSVTVMELAGQLTERIQGTERDKGLIFSAFWAASARIDFIQGTGLKDALAVADAVGQSLDTKDGGQRPLVAVRAFAFEHTGPYDEIRAVRAATLINAATEGWDPEADTSGKPQDAEWLSTFRPELEMAVQCATLFSRAVDDPGKRNFLAIEARTGRALLAVL